MVCCLLVLISVRRLPPPLSLSLSLCCRRRIREYGTSAVCVRSSLMLAAKTDRMKKRMQRAVASRTDKGGALNKTDTQNRPSDSIAGEDNDKSRARAIPATGAGGTRVAK